MFFSRYWDKVLLDVAFKKLHIRIGEHNYVQSEKIDEASMDLGIDPIHIPKIFKSIIILKIGHLHLSRIRTEAASRGMNRILEKLSENKNALASLEIRNCENIESLNLESLLTNLQSLVLLDLTGRDHFFTTSGGLSSIVEKISRSDVPLEKLLIHHRDLDKINDETVSDAFCKMKEVEVTWSMSKTQTTLMFLKIAKGSRNIKKLLVEEWGKIQLDYDQITPDSFTLAICKIVELKTDFSSKEHTKMLFETLSKNPGQLKSLTFADLSTIEDVADANTIAQAVCNLEKIFFKSDISEGVQTAIFRIIANKKGVRLKTLHMQSVIKCTDTMTFIKATLTLENVYFFIGDDLVAQRVENTLLDSMLKGEDCKLKCVTLIFRNPKHFNYNKKLFQYPEEKLVRIKEKIGKLNIFYSPLGRGGFEKLFS